MPIEFRCSQCGKLLRTEDQFAGKKAMCPQCNAIQDVPAESTADANLPPPDSGVPNPYVSPAGATYAAGGQSPFTASSQKIEAGDVLSRAWEIYKNQLGMAIVGVLITMLPLGVFFGTAYVGGIVTLVVMDESGVDDDTIALVIIPLAVIAIGIYVLLAMWFQAGMYMYYLKMARGEPVRIGDLFRGGPLLLPLLVTVILNGLIVELGILACIVPGILLWLMLSQQVFLIVDRRAGVIESFGMSMRLMQGNKLQYAMVMLAMFGISMLAVCVPGGQIFVMPFMLLTMSVAYLIVSGQPTAGVVQPYAYRPA